MLRQSAQVRNPNYLAKEIPHYVRNDNLLRITTAHAIRNTQYPHASRITSSSCAASANRVWYSSSSPAGGMKYSDNKGLMDVRQRRSRAGAVRGSSMK